MSLRIVSAILLALSSVSSAEKDPLSQCSWLSNPKVAPLIYLSQSELAVLAHYSAFNHAAIQKGTPTSFYITPVCYVKGYYPGMEIEVWSGYQKCKVEVLSSLKEFPSLFFLRKDPQNSRRWLLLNGGEYQHRVDRSGLLFGVGAGAEDFPQVCGVQRRRIPIDVKKCESMTCRGYCSYALAPADNCKNKTELIRRSVGTTIKDTPAFGIQTEIQPKKGGTKEEKEGTTMKNKTGSGKDANGQSVTYAPGPEDRASVKPGIVKGNGAEALTQTSTAFLLAVIVAWCYTR